MKSKLFLLLMLISGFAGISYEILYGRILGNLIGDQFAVSAAILITFLLGIGMGSHVAWRLWPWLWLIELMIGLCGIAFALSTDMLDTMLYASLPLLPAGLSGSVIACMVLLLLPAFLIGCSVPLFAGYMSCLRGGAAFSKVYAVYNIGAAITALLIEYLLLRWFGIEGAVFCFATLNVLIAIVLRFAFVVPRQYEGRFQSRQFQTSQSHSNQFQPRQSQLEKITSWPWAKLIPISMASAVFQLFMVKMAEMLLGPFRESFALVLSIVLLGIALGSILVHLFKWRFEMVVLIACVGLLIFISSVEPVAYVYASLYASVSESYWSTVLLKWVCLFLLMGLPCLAFGATVPALINEHTDDVSRQSGKLLFVASMANVVGFLLMVFVLHRYLDYGVIVLVVVLLCSLSLLLSPGLNKRAIMAAGILLMGSTTLYAYSWDEDILYVSYTNFRSTDGLNEARQNFSMSEKFKGYHDVFAINWVKGSPRFFINGYNSIALNSPSEKIVGALSAIFSPHQSHGLVLGLGSGATASVVGQLFEHTDVVEINAVVRENLFRMKQWNFDIESNPSVEIIVDDAIHYIKATQQQYDLILNTVTTPLYFSSSKLYTHDFFEAVKQRLQPDGVYVTWMDARVGDKGADIILHTLRNSFKYGALLYIKSSYFLLICSNEPIKATALPSFKSGHAVYDEMLQTYGIIPEWLQYQLLTDDVFALISDAAVPLNEANYPALEFEMAQLSSRGIGDFKARLQQTMDINEVRQVLAIEGNMAEENYPAELVWHALLRLKNASFYRQWKYLAEANNSDFEQSYAQVQQAYVERLYAAGRSAKALHQFAFKLMKMRQYEAALLAFQRVLMMDFQHNNTHFNMAACYEYLGDFNAALDYYQREAELDPDDEDVPYRLGRVLVKMNRYAEALGYLNEAVQMMGEAGNPKVYDYLGVAYAELGQVEKSKVTYQKALLLRQEKAK